MTPAEHAATVREAIGADVDAPDSEQREGAALIALDALQAQAEEQALAIAAYLTRAEAAEAERDRLADELTKAIQRNAEVAARVTELEARASDVLDAYDSGTDLIDALWGLRAALAEETT